MSSTTTCQETPLWLLGDRNIHDFECLVDTGWLTEKDDKDKEEITAAAAVATVAATATAAAAGGPGSGLSSMAGMGNIPTGLPQPGTGIRKSVRNREH